MDKVPQHAYQVALLACIVNRLHQIAISMSDETSPCDMTVSQLITIGFLYFSRQKEVYQRDIEAYFKLRRSTVSSQLNTLEKKGLIQRLPVPHDARLKKLVLTEQGLTVSSEVLQRLNKINDLMIQGLSQEEVEQLTTLLRKVEQNLSEANP